MAKHNILSVEEIEHFLERVRVTVHAAHESHSLKEALSLLVGRGQSAHLAKASAKAQSGGGAEANAGRESGAKRRGRQARVADSHVLDLIRRGANGVGMRELEKELGQHVETIRLKLRKLRQEGHVRTTGPRNQLRYHATSGGGGETSASAPANGASEAKTKGRGGRKPAVKIAAPSGGKRRGGRKAAAAPEGIEDRLVGLIRDAGAGGTQMNHLAAELKVDVKSIRRLLDRLRTNGQIQVTGQRRATRYHAAG